jgi:hypothetical protein
VNFTPTPSAACAEASECAVDAGGETFFYNIVPEAPNNQVDILIVDDNSVSMLQRQQTLATHFPDFIQMLGNMDWRIAIVTTDNTTLDPNCNTYICQQIRLMPQYMKDHKNAQLVPFLNADHSSTGRYFIDRNTPNAAALFTNTIQRPESVWCSTHPSYRELCTQLISGDERGIYSAKKIVSGNPHNFIRSTAQLHVIIVSDEDERSNGGGYVPPLFSPAMPLESGHDYPQDLIAAFGSKRAAVHAITNLPAGAPYAFNFITCVQNQINNVSTDDYDGCYYIQTANQTNGVVGSLNGNYTDLLQDAVHRMQDNFIDHFAFSCVPDMVTVHKLDTYPLPPGFADGQILNVNSSSIDFNPPIEYGTALRLEVHCAR